MAVLLETNVGDLVIDLDLHGSPKLCENFLKLCKARFYNNTLIYNVTTRFFQAGDPIGTGKGGACILGAMDGDVMKSSKRFLKSRGRRLTALEFREKGRVVVTELTRNCRSAVADTVGSQFLVTLESGEGRALTVTPLTTRVKDRLRSYHLAWLWKMTTVCWKRLPRATPSLRSRNYRCLSLGDCRYVIITRGARLSRLMQQNQLYNRLSKGRGSALGNLPRLWFDTWRGTLRQDTRPTEIVSAREVEAGKLGPAESVKAREVYRYEFHPLKGEKKQSPVSMKEHPLHWLAVSTAHELVLQHLIVHLTKPENTRSVHDVLDVGSGVGGSFFSLLNVFGGSNAFTYRGISISAAETSFARRLSRLHSLNGNTHFRFNQYTFDSPLPSSKYSVVLAIESLAFSNNLSQTMFHETKWREAASFGVSNVDDVRFLPRFSFELKYL